MLNWLNDEYGDDLDGWKGTILCVVFICVLSLIALRTDGCFGYKNIRNPMLYESQKYDEPEYHYGYE